MTSTNDRLDATGLRHFQDEGYVVLPAFLDDDDHRTALKAELDELMRLRAGDRDAGPAPLEMREHGLLISHPPIMAMVEQLMGPGFAHHHMHSTRMDAGHPGVDWHQDYVQIPHSNRSHLMVHVFYYLNGLDGTIGDLLLLPRSQHLLMDSTPACFGTADLPGSIVVDDLPPGTAVIVNSALLHARRAKAGGERKPRYFVDSSYCQAGVRWPSSHDFGGTWRFKLRRALELGLDRDGRYAHLFDERHFIDMSAARRRMWELAQGSLAERLLSSAPSEEPA